MAVESVLYENMDSSPKPWGWLSSICEKNKWRGRAEKRIAEKGRKTGRQLKWEKTRKQMNVGLFTYECSKKALHQLSQDHPYDSDKIRSIEWQNILYTCIRKKKSYPTPNFKLRLLFYLWVLWGHCRISNWLNIVHWRFDFADKYLMINWCKLFDSLAPPPSFNEGVIVRSGTLFRIIWARWKAISCIQFHKLGSILFLLL